MYGCCVCVLFVYLCLCLLFVNHVVALSGVGVVVCAVLRLCVACEMYVCIVCK